MIPEDIQKGIDVTIGVLQRRYPSFNPNSDSSFIGLCNETSDIFLKAMKNISDKDGKIIHGEIRHNAKTHSSYWDVEHTWVKYQGYYIDLTCGQFRNIIRGIPSQYVSKRSPKWFLPDKKNWSLHSKLCFWLLYHIKAPICDFIYDKRNKMGRN